MHWSSVAIVEASVDLIKKTDASGSEQSPSTPLHGPYAMTIQRDDGPYDVASFFCKVTFGVRISVSISSNAMLTADSLIDTGAGPNIIGTDFLPTA